MLGLGLAGLGTPTLVGLMTWAVTGLILLDEQPTQTRVARMLPGRCHDVLNRLLRVMSWSSRALMALLIAFAQRLGCAGYLILDDVIVEKAFARRLPGSCPGRVVCTRLPRNARPGESKSSCYCGVRWMVAGAFRSDFGCGGPNGLVRRPIIGPS
ncbi:MAG: hypothetical protein JXM69_16915 [Anaerolineae bacterium]|nr:hypothetical protein [Anaerolineae bacterium]